MGCGRQALLPVVLGQMRVLSAICPFPIACVLTYHPCSPVVKHSSSGIRLQGFGFQFFCLLVL